MAKHHKIEQLSDLIDTEQLIKTLNVSRRTISTLIKDGKLTVIKVPGMRKNFFDKQQILKSLKVQAA